MNNVPDAEDMLQETFIKIFNNLKMYKTNANFYTWANRIAINNCINQQKKRGVAYDYEYQDNLGHNVADTNYSEASLSANVKAIHNGISQLPNGYREIISLYLLEGLDHKEIAEVLKISESTSKSQYARAKKKLRESITYQHG